MYGRGQFKTTFISLKREKCFVLRYKKYFKTFKILNLPFCFFFNWMIVYSRTDHILKFTDWQKEYSMLNYKHFDYFDFKMIFSWRKFNIKGNFDSFFLKDSIWCFWEDVYYRSKIYTIFHFFFKKILRHLKTDYLQGNLFNAIAKPIKRSCVICLHVKKASLHLYMNLTYYIVG